MLVAIFGFNAGKPLAVTEAGWLYLAAYGVILLCGPGKVSVDGMMGK
jgi:hypothetical protein